jgi:hypothetical protein
MYSKFNCEIRYNTLYHKINKFSSGFKFLKRENNILNLIFRRRIFFSISTENAVPLTLNVESKVKYL